MKKNAFTLIELLIVIAIAVIITGALVPLFSVTKQDAKIASMIMLLETLKTACGQYHLDTGEYALEVGMLPEDCSDPQNRRLSCDSGVSGWGGPYINSPLKLGDGYIVVNNNLAGFDLDGDGSNERSGAGNSVTWIAITDEYAKKIDDILDKGVPTSGSDDWKVKGRIIYRSDTHFITYYLMGG